MEIVHASLDGHSRLFCITEKKAGQKAISAWSLEDGEQYLLPQGSITGAVKPGGINENALLQLSQIRPVAENNASGRFYSAYCFLAGGSFSAAVPLYNASEAKAYLNGQKEWQHRVLICDEQGMRAFETENGNLIFTQN